MVIKSKNKKRKLSENVEVEEDVPVKVVKNVKSVDDDSSNEMEVDEMYERNVPADSDEGEGDKQDQEEPEDGEERDIQFKRSFNIKYFREQLREKNSILGESSYLITSNIVTIIYYFCFRYSPFHPSSNKRFKTRCKIYQ